jgi:glycosyltransferase involved in cell wall biosynthesis
MRILLVMDPGILVPPKGYGGHERLVYMFAREYARLGHEVHLLVTEGSVVEGCTVHSFGKEGFPPKKWDARMAIPTAWRFLWKHRNQFDLIHNFGRLAYLFPVLNHRIKKIMTYGREISSKNIQLTNKLPNKNIVYTGCSKDLISRVDAVGRWEAVYNAIEFGKYTVQEKVAVDAPLMFLGRIEQIKGAHTAIKVAKATGDNLILAGNISPLADERAYFEQEIKPLIDDVQIKYVGALNDEQKNFYLGQSKALLFPIEWNEPFGMVMTEAMACGTPVIGFKKGSVPEVIEHNITGKVVVSEAEMIAAVADIHSINRIECRRIAQSRFDVPVIANHYLSLFNS